VDRDVARLSAQLDDLFPTDGGVSEDNQGDLGEGGDVGVIEDAASLTEDTTAESALDDILKEAKQVPKHVDFKFSTKADKERDVDDDLGESNDSEADVAGIITSFLLYAFATATALHCDYNGANYNGANYCS